VRDQMESTWPTLNEQLEGPRGAGSGAAATG